MSSASVGNMNLLSLPGGAIQRPRHVGAFQVFEMHGLRPCAEVERLSQPDAGMQDAGAKNAEGNLLRLKALGVGLAFVASAMLLRRLAPYQASLKWEAGGWGKYLSVDWKDWAKIALGITGVNQFNQALAWQPPPWLNAMQNVVLITPLMLGKAGFGKIPAMAVLVAGLVQGTSLLSNKLETPLSENLHLPPAITRMLLSIGATVLGVASFPWIARTGLMGSDAMSKAIQAKAGGGMAQGAGTGTVLCSNCGGAHLLCMTDIGEFFGAIGSWFHSKLGDSPS